MIRTPYAGPAAAIVGASAAIALGLAFASLPTVAVSAPRLQSGVYEGLELMVAPDGAVAGGFTRDTDTLPHRICAFSFTGHVRPDGSANIIVRSSADDPVLSGSLIKTNDGVELHVPKLTSLPACDQLAEIPPHGVPFERIGPPNGTWLATISSTRAELHLAPTGTPWRGYLVKDDIVSLGRREGARWEASFLSPAGKRAHGWLDAADIQPFARR